MVHGGAVASWFALLVVAFGVRERVSRALTDNIEQPESCGDSLKCTYKQKFRRASCPAGFERILGGLQCKRKIVWSNVKCHPKRNPCQEQDYVCAGRKKKCYIPSLRVGETKMWCSSWEVKSAGLCFTPCLEGFKNVLGVCTNWPCIGAGVKKFFGAVAGGIMHQVCGLDKMLSLVVTPNEGERIARYNDCVRLAEVGCPQYDSDCNSLIECTVGQLTASRGEQVQACTKLVAHTIYALPTLATPTAANVWSVPMIANCLQNHADKCGRPDGWDLDGCVDEITTAPSPPPPLAPCKDDPWDCVVRQGNAGVCKPCSQLGHRCGQGNGHVDRHCPLTCGLC